MSHFQRNKYHRADHPKFGAEEERSEFQESKDTSSKETTQEDQDDEEVQNGFFVFNLFIF